MVVTLPPAPKEQEVRMGNYYLPCGGLMWVYHLKSSVMAMPKYSNSIQRYMYITQSQSKRMM